MRPCARFDTACLIRVGTWAGSRLGRRPVLYACKPTAQIGVGRVERLTDLSAEIHEAKEQDIGQREALSAEEFATLYLAVQPFETVGGDLLEPLGGLRDRDDPVLEQRETLGKTEAVRHGFADVEVDAPGPHARLGPLLGRGADQCGFRIFLLE